MAVVLLLAGLGGEPFEYHLLLCAMHRKLLGVTRSLLQTEGLAARSLKY